MRRAPLLLSVALLLPLAGGAGGQGGLPEPWFRVSERPVLVGAADLHGRQVAFASPRPEGLDIVVADLEARTERVVTTVGRAVSVQGFAFDGQWIVWSDDRFGQHDIFAAEVATGRLVRVTEHPAEDVHVDAEGGRLVWSRPPDLMTVDLPSDEERLFVPTAGPGAEPRLDGARVIWSHAQGGARGIALRGLDADRHVLVSDWDVTGKASPSLAGHVAVWLALVPVRNARTGAIESVGTVVQMGVLPRSEGQSTQVLNLTDVISAREPVVNGTRAAWLELLTGDRTVLRVLDLESGRSFVVAGPVSRGLLGPDHLAVVQASAGTGLLAARPWPERGEIPAAGGGPNWALLGIGSALVLIGLGWGAWRRSRGSLRPPRRD